MFRNSEIEIRKQLKIQEHYAKLRAAKEAYKPKPKLSFAHANAKNLKLDGTITFNDQNFDVKNSQIKKFSEQEAHEFKIVLQDPNDSQMEPFRADTESIDGRIEL